MRIGIIREGKVPPDSRVALTPEQCAFVQKNFSIEVVVQPSPVRCYPDIDYSKMGINLSEDLTGCDILLGVKEVPTKVLIPEKIYFFFSHTIKKQPHNQQLLWAILDKNIRLIDYEALKDENGNRLIAFGYFAGMVGAHNALWTYGERTKSFHLKRMKEFDHYEEAKAYYQTVSFPPVKIVLTGTGRVSSGAVEVLRDMGIRKVSPEDFLAKEFNHAVFTQLDSLHYVKRKDGKTFNKEDFYENPQQFESAFSPYYQTADIMINGIYWDYRAPVFFTKEEMHQPNFAIEVIADVTCDIAPKSSVPSTIRPSSIAEPVYGFAPQTGEEATPFSPKNIDVMAIDNLPNELPRDASTAFGNQFIKHILPEILKRESEMLDKATVAEDGRLGKHFQYLQDYAGAEAANH